MSRGKFVIKYTDREVKYWTAGIFTISYIFGIVAGIALASVLS